MLKKILLPLLFSLLLLASGCASAPPVGPEGIPTPSVEVAASLPPEEGNAVQRSIVVIATGDVHLMLVDPEGQRLGYDASTEELFSEMPEGNYFPDPEGQEHTIIAYTSVEGTYTLLLTGRAEGSYRVMVGTGEVGNTETQIASTGTIQEGETIIQRFQVPKR
jgi:hypothetical protein